MGVSLISRDYSTNFCKFAYDTEEDIKNLPNMKSRGKEGLSNILSCSHASLAIGTNGKDYILTGENVWKEYTGNFGSGSSGGGSSDSGGSGGSNDGFIEL